MVTILLVLIAFACLGQSILLYLKLQQERREKHLLLEETKVLRKHVGASDEALKRLKRFYKKRDKRRQEQILHRDGIIDTLNRVHRQEIADLIQVHEDYLQDNFLMPNYRPSHSTAA